jgi:hypothetical protein
LNQIRKWKNSLSNATTQTGKTELRSTNNNECSSTHQTNPFLNLIDIFKTPINQNEIGTAMSSLETNTTNVSQMVPNYLSAINSLETFGSDMVPADDRVYYRCKACNKVVWVAKGMSALTEFPGCFECQKQWLASLGGLFKGN